MSVDDWSAFHRRWSRLKPPLRPNDEVVAAMQSLIRDCDGPTLLLGVTPDLASIADEMIAMDWSPEMIRNVWPGDTATRRAICANWLDLPLPDASCAAVVGDGSMNCMRWPDPYRQLFGRLVDVVRPDGVVALRFYTAPGDAETLDALAAETLQQKVRGFHALKWRLASVCAAKRGEPNVPVQEILAAFERAFPDRSNLARATGWSLNDIAEIDAYDGSQAVYSFPTRAQILATVPEGFSAKFHDVGSYELAERCPLLVLRRQ